VPKALLEDLAAAPPPRWSGPTPFRSIQEMGVFGFFLACAVITVLTTAGIVLVLGIETVAFFRVSQESITGFLFGREIDTTATPPRFGILPLIWGTMVIAVGSSVIALPIGLLSAIYLSEYAPRGVRMILKPTLELLAGIPSIVYGYLALLLVTPLLSWLVSPFEVSVSTYNALSGCIVVGIMVVPLVSSLSEDVLSAVPRGLREAAYGLGATKFEVSTQIVLPAGLSGVISSFILATSRAIGETMAVVLAAGSLAQISLNPFTEIETMTAYIVGVNSGQAEDGSAERLSLFAVGMTLFLMTLILNLLSLFILRRFREKYQ
jgi:phosphate transport system permease protein